MTDTTGWRSGGRAHRFRHHQPTGDRGMNIEEIYTHSGSTPWEPVTLESVTKLMAEFQPIDNVTIDVLRIPFDPDKMLLVTSRRHSKSFAASHDYHVVSAEEINRLERR